MEKFPDKYFVIDFENSGGNLEKGHKITGVGVVIVEKKNGSYQITKEYSTYINPERPIPYFIENLLGISSDELNSDKYPYIEEVFDELEKLYNYDKIFVAHCISVDYNMFNYHYKKKYGFDFECYGIDTHKLAKNLLGYKKCSIGDLYINYNISESRHHQPDFDAKISAFILIEALNKFEKSNRILKDFIVKYPKKNG
ncbi:MAG TPA: exonuclease domain-containing protein [bacterium]|nr:exonuclease domain-containing protein [bacterium]HOL48365.1 exonuclease domain-containing protein [bacterium]HPQ19468.1 exonuclease domain-containing protein [bacterium]